MSIVDGGYHDEFRLAFSRLRATVLSIVHTYNLFSSWTFPCSAMHLHQEAAWRHYDFE